jgi:MFS family permease
MTAPAHPDHEPSGHPLEAWMEPRTLLLGLFVFCMAFMEGTGNDWLGVAVIDGYDASPAVGSLTLGIFLAAMTTGRWFGPALLDRFGRLASVRASAVIACSGALLVVFGGSLAVAMAGAVLWGLGSALGFPVGMSAAADESRFAAGRVGVVTSIGYVAFLAGPPFVGLLGNAFGTLHSLIAVAGLAAAALLLSRVLRPRPVRAES